MLQVGGCEPTLIQILDRLACPDCRAGLSFEHNGLSCPSCHSTYPIVGEIVDLRPKAQREKPEMLVWAQHWSDDQQQTVAQRFFSLYRKAVFSRTVEYFLNRYFPSSGVFVEAGSGTSETSMRVDKRAGKRKLVAVDIVLSVLTRCHPVMDARVSGDVFRLPFRGASVDGIWNVGVMEHFTHAQIDLILQEFHRILRNRARLILLWPGRMSLPQKMLRMVEGVINLKRRQERLRFHPDEISQLKSTREARQVMARNGFDTVHIDWGVRSLMAFITVVGTKRPPAQDQQDRNSA